MEVIVLRSNRGGEKILVGNFGYHFRSKSVKGIYRWVCVDRKALSCKSLVLTKKVGDKHKITAQPTEHNHPGLKPDKLVRIKTEAEKYPVPPDPTVLRVPSVETDPLAGQFSLPRGITVIENHRMQSNNTRDLDEHSTGSFSSFGQNAPPEPVEITCEPDREIQRQAFASLKPSALPMEEESFHINDMKLLPQPHAFVRSDQESDGTVNIRIFLEESLLSSFVVNAQHTSNVNIRISKDDLYKNNH